MSIGAYAGWLVIFCFAVAYPFILGEWSKLAAPAEGAEATA